MLWNDKKKSNATTVIVIVRWQRQNEKFWIDAHMNMHTYTQAFIMMMWHEKKEITGEFFPSKYKVFYFCMHLKSWSLTIENWKKIQWWFFASFFYFPSSFETMTIVIDRKNTIIFRLWKLSQKLNSDRGFNSSEFSEILLEFNTSSNFNKIGSADIMWNVSVMDAKLFASFHFT